MFDLEKLIEYLSSVDNDNVVLSNPFVGPKPRIRKIFFDCGKLAFLTAEKMIVLVILKTNASVEIIKTYRHMF